MIAATAVSESRAQRRNLGISLNMIPLDFICHWPLQSMSSEQRFSNLASMNISLDSKQSSGHCSDKGALRSMLASATSLKQLRLESRPSRALSFNDEIARFLSSCLVDQHWEHLEVCKLFYPVEESTLLPFLARHADTIVDMTIYMEPSVCLYETISMLDQAKKLLDLQRASAVLAGDYEGFAYCQDRNCDCQFQMSTSLNDRRDEDGNWDIGNCILSGDCTYDDVSETWQMGWILD